MAAELEKLAIDLARFGYSTGAQHLRREASVLRRRGLIPDSIGRNNILGEVELTIQELATRVYNIGDVLSRVPTNANGIIQFTFGNKSLDLMYEYEDFGILAKKRVLYGGKGFIPTALGNGGIVFEANIEHFRRDELKPLGVDPMHSVAVGAHMEDSSRDRALAYLEETGYNGFETNYLFDVHGKALKLSHVPIDFDNRPDILNNLNASLGTKRVRGEITPRDLKLIDNILYICETAVPTK